MEPLSREMEALVSSQRVARLATADSQGTPHIVPVCFAYDGRHFYSVIDRKPKRAASPLSLKRVRNIMANPRVALLIDVYYEDWGRLWFIMVLGRGELIERGEEYQRALALLKEKYLQYRAMDIEGRAVIKITPQRTTRWGKIPKDTLNKSGA